MTTPEYILKSAALRGSYRFDEAIKLIEENIPPQSSDYYIPALLECFNAAREKGNRELTSKYAKLIYEMDPDIPGVKSHI